MTSSTLHQFPYEMWVEYVEGTRADIETLCGLTIKPEIPLDDKKPRCLNCWPPRRTPMPGPPALSKEYMARPIVVEAIHVDPSTPDQISKVLEWGKQKSIPMTWLGEDRGLNVKLNGINVAVPTLNYLIRDAFGNVTHYPPDLFWIMYEEVDE